MNKLKISLSQWSLHRTFFGNVITDWDIFFHTLATEPDSLLKGVDPMEFPRIAAELGFDTIELVNSFYFSKDLDFSYWDKFKQHCGFENVKVGLVMCDGLGRLGDSELYCRQKALRKYMNWIDVAAYLGAESVRVNADGNGSKSEISKYNIDSLHILGEYAHERNMNILVENHGGYSTDAKWLKEIIQKVDKNNVGTLPDFGNFCVRRDESGCIEGYDVYEGMVELMPFAKGVSAKSIDFDGDGNETMIDYKRVLDIIKLSGYEGFIGIEYEGNRFLEKDGVLKTKKLIEKFY